MTRFTPEQEQSVVDEYLSGKSLRQVAHAYGVTTRPIQRILRNHGIKPRRTGRSRTVLPDSTIQAIRTAYDDGATVQGLTERYQCPRPAIWRALDSTGGTRNRRGSSLRAFSSEDRASVKARFLAGETQVSLAKAFGCSPTTLARVLRQEGVSRDGRGQRRELHHAWKGGRAQREDGYIIVRPERDDPIGQAMVHKNGYVMEHRLVMAHHIGRPLTDEETVHHGPGGKQDNRIENLGLWASRHPRGQRIEDLVAFAHEILDLYGDIPSAVSTVSMT